LPSKCHFTSFLYTLEVRKRAVDPKMEATCLEFNQEHAWGINSCFFYAVF